MRDENQKHSAHLGVLFTAVALAVAIWFIWLYAGARWAHRQVADQVAAPAPSASAPAIDRPQVFSELGQTGDSFGSINALLTALAGAIVFWAGYLQKEQLNQARRDAASAKIEAAEERKSRQKQEFESLFFRLLDLSRDITEKVETPRVRIRARYTNPANGTTAFETARGRTGSAALHHFAWKIDSNWNVPDNEEELLRRLVDRFKKQAYNRAPSAFGPYFRILYQTFKHVAEATSLSEQETVRYANLARGQISEGAVLLLALNGLTLDGYKFVPLIERFGLLEHLHTTYRARYGKALLIGYRPRAFMGSEDRARPGNEWRPVPLLPANQFGDVGSTNEEELEDAFEEGFYGATDDA